MFLIKTKVSIIFLSLFLCFFQCAYAGKPINKTNNDTAIQNAILFYINEYRQQHGLTSLKMDNRIVKEAKQHSIDMATHKMGFGHQYFHNRIDRLHHLIKDSNAGAENVAYNYRDAQDVVKNWLRSPGHKQNIDGNYNLTGIGIARDKNGKIYFTQIFLKTGTTSKYAARRPFTNLFNKSLFKRST